MNKKECVSESYEQNGNVNVTFCRGQEITELCGGEKNCQ